MVENLTHDLVATWSILTADIIFGTVLSVGKTNLCLPANPTAVPISFDRVRMRGQEIAYDIKRLTIYVVVVGYFFFFF